MPQPWIQPRGKPEKKTACLPYCGDETTTRYDRAFEGNDPVMGFVLGRVVNQIYLLKLFDYF